MRRWLAAVAGLTLVAGAPVGGAEAVRARTSVKAKQVKHAPRRVVRRRARAAVVAPPLIIPAPPTYATPPASGAPAPAYAGYRWLDDADAMLGAIAGSPPDVAFAVDRDARFAWRLGDGTVAIAEPLSQFERRWYFFERDVTVPFLVRDVGRSFAFDRGRLAAVYDANGMLRDGPPPDLDARDAADLLDRGRRLWFAARDPRPLPPREQLSGWSLRFDFGSGDRDGGFGGWRENGDLLAYRGGVGDDRRRARDDRYRHEREQRRARGVYGWQAGDGFGANRSADGAAPPPRPRPSVQRSSEGMWPQTEPAFARPPRHAERRAPDTPAPMPPMRQEQSNRAEPGGGEPPRTRVGRPREQAERRDDGPAVASPATDATPAPGRERRRAVEPEIVPSPSAAPAAEPERTPPPRAPEPEPEAAPPVAAPPAAEPERTPPPPAPEPVAAPAPPPERAAPPPQPEPEPEQPQQQPTLQRHGDPKTTDEPQ